MRHGQRKRDGFALAVAIGAIVVIGALIAGVFFEASQQFRIGRGTLLQERARAAAENGLHILFDPTQQNLRWKPAWNNAPTGMQTQVVFTSDGAIDTVRLTKLTPTNFLLVSDARVVRAHQVQAKRRVGMLVTLRVPEINIRGALTVRGALKVTGSSQISGNDTPINNWNCPPADTALPGVASSDTTKIDASGGCGGYACISGNPKVVQDTMASKDSTYFQFGDVDWATLTSMAKQFTAGTPAPSTNVDGTCNTADPANWGDPLRTTSPAPCADYYPIIYAPSSLSLQNGVGQGILLVEGDLKVTGNFTFYGPVIVKGTFSTQGNGAHFNGGLMAANVDLDPNTVAGNAIINYSSCALSRAVNGAATPLPAQLRPWVELF
ncbi:MAG TPA: hypothetical protein VF166_15380 [Gemmatimonadaceae bacterium]